MEAKASSPSAPADELEVRLLQLLAREVGVELGGGEVGVAEHLLHRAQVAVAGEQVRGEGVAQGVRAPLQGRQPGRADETAASDAADRGQAIHSRSELFLGPT
jgi:hypothetical protein